MQQDYLLRIVSRGVEYMKWNVDRQLRTWTGGVRVYITRLIRSTSSAIIWPPSRASSSILTAIRSPGSATPVVTHASTEGQTCYVKVNDISKVNMEVATDVVLSIKAAESGIGWHFRCFICELERNLMKKMCYRSRTFTSWNSIMHSWLDATLGTGIKFL